MAKHCVQETIKKKIVGIYDAENMSVEVDGEIKSLSDVLSTFDDREIVFTVSLTTEE